MGLFKPTMYRSSIFDIDYDKLKCLGVTCLIFDLDNTIGLVDDKKCSSETIKLINSLKKDFVIFICSNNTKRRLRPYLEDLGVSGYSFCLKPFTRTLNKISKKYNYEKVSMCVIGDQLLTDILSANRYQVMSILVNPMNKKEHLLTGINRMIESRIFKKYEKKKILMRGKYYE